MLPVRLQRAFTLIELLVVVAILALLISLLLPALSRAREQGKIAVCLANLRSHGQACMSYLHEEANLPWCLPFTYRVGSQTYSFNCVSSFAYAGGLPDRTAADWNATGIPGIAPLGCDVYRLPPRLRPMNRHYASEVSWNRELNERTTLPADIPPFFRCPSDSTAAVTLLGTRNPELEYNTAFTTWSFWGNSYPMNWGWAYYFWHPVEMRGTQLGQNPPYSRNLGRILGAFPTQARGLGERILREKNAFFTAEFILIFENKLGYALEGSLPRGLNNESAKRFLGWHNQIDYHSALFLDGHARYTRYDTRYPDGPGWTIWPNRPWEDDWAPYTDR